MLVTYADSRGFTAASTSVVIARSYSRYSRSTSLRHRHHRVGVLLGEDRAHPLLVRRVGVGVQEADAEGVDALVAEPAGDRAGAVLVERPHLGAGEVEPAADALAPGRAGRSGPASPRSRSCRSRRARTAGRSRASPRSPSLVTNPSRSTLPSSSWLVATVVPWLTAEIRSPVGADQAEHLLDAGQEAVGRVARRRRRLRRHQLAGVLVEGDDVGERAAGVDADPDACAGRLRHARLPGRGGTWWSRSSSPPACPMRRRAAGAACWASTSRRVGVVVDDEVGVAADLEPVPARRRARGRRSS